MLPPELRETFEGYVRPGGKTGTRNYIGILTSVNCSASAARFIAREVERSGVLADHPEIDGIVPFVHGTGCGLAAYGEGFDVLRRTQWGYATHANLGAALMVGLGCEVFQIDRMKDEYGLVEGDHFQTMTIQATGGTKKTVAEGVERIKAMIPIAARAKRETRPASEVTLALQCGGSDGYSGITANPALGAAVDELVRHGGTAILSETPEIYGAEHLLTRRAVNRAVGEKLVERIKWWEAYCERNGGEMNNNPSPGNKAGGLTTILEKSLGAAAKGGTTTMRAVYEYAEPVKEKGFVFMDTPGYDPVGATGQVAGGANVMCFTTGRGSAFGCKPTPSVKLATNSQVYASMIDDMDINCGDILDGVSVAAEGRGDFPQGAGDRVRAAHQVGGSGIRRRRVRAVADRRGDVAAQSRDTRLTTGPRRLLVDELAGARRLRGFDALRRGEDFGRLLSGFALTSFAGGEAIAAEPNVAIPTLETRHLTPLVPRPGRRPSSAVP